MFIVQTTLQTIDRTADINRKIKNLKKENLYQEQKITMNYIEYNCICLKSKNSINQITVK